MRRRHRHDDDVENPAWPGLVDLFAFGMVVILFLWVGATQTTPGPPIPPGQPPDHVIAARERAQRLMGRMKGESADVVFVPNPPAVEVHGLRGHQVFFGTDRYDLDTADREAVGRLGQLVEQEIRNQPEFVVLVNGTADPRPFKSPIPPRDNVELSALRAAAVSKILVDAGLKGRLQVIGLGERGALTGQSDQALKPFRKVYLTVQVLVDEVRRQIEATPGQRR